MRRIERSLAFAALFVLALRLCSNSPQLAVSQANHRWAASYAHRPLAFEENRGQTDAAVRYLARGAGYTLFLTSDEAVLRVRTASQERQAKSPRHVADLRRVGRMRPLAARQSSVIRMRLEDANISAEISGDQELPARSHYLTGNDSTKWADDIANFAQVIYRDIYPGINLVYYGNAGQLEFDFQIAPGADPSRIRLRLDGANKLKQEARGELSVELDGGEKLILCKPTIYQEVAGQRREIAGGYSIDGQELRFSLAPYDASLPVTIDPVLSYSTYLGGATEDSVRAIAVDSAGSAYVTGETDSINFPTASALQSSIVGDFDAYVAKLNPAGNGLVYSTYLGGSALDFANGIAVDANGDAIVTGYTEGINFPLVAPLQANYGGGVSNAFVAKLNPSGSALLFSTYLGGNGQILGDSGNAIALDGAGNIYVTGVTDSTNFPVSANAFQRILASADAFVTKINPTGSALIYSTYFGGNDLTVGSSIAVDGSGNAYITGTTFATNLPTVSPFETAPTNGDCGGFPCPDAFVTKVNPAGALLVFSTYLGGASDDEGSSIDVDSSQNVYVTGFTASTNFPVLNAVQGTKGTGYDAFVTKLNTSGSSLSYSTFLGAGGFDSGYAIKVTASGTAYVAGQTGSNAFPVLNPIQQTRIGNFDAFALSLTPSGGLIYSTYLGGTGWEDVYGGALDSAGSFYVGGETESSNFPTVGPFQSAYSGGNCGTAPNTFPCDDGFIAKITDLNPAPTVTSLSPASAATGGPAFNLTVNGTGFVSVSQIRWNGNSRPTTFVSNTRLTAAITASDIASDGTAQISVFNGAPGGGASNALPFTIGSIVSNPAPSLTLLGPPSAQAGGAAFTLTATGSNFVSTSVVRWNGADRPTTFVDTTHLTAQIAAADIAATGTAQVTVFNPLPGGGTSGAVPFSIVSPGNLPTFTGAGLVDAASFLAGPVAPGSIATLFGTNLATGEAFAQTLPLPTTLGTTTLRLNGTAVPLFYVNPTQINFQMPWEISLSGTITISVSVGASSSSANFTPNAAISPGVFSTNSQGTGQGAVLISNTATFAAPAGSIPGASARPANHSEFITIYCTSLGAVSNQPQSGAIAGSSPLSRTTITPLVTIGGVQASVSFSGLAPGFVGLYQIDVPVPNNAPSDAAVPVAVSVNGLPANTITIAIQ